MLFMTALLISNGTKAAGFAASGASDADRPIPREGKKQLRKQ
jgi:hypothetical protein